MRKFMVAAIPIATLILFILIMQSGFILKGPLGQNDDIPGAIKELMEYVRNDEWETVGHKTEELEKMWQGIVKRVQFSAERDEINFFSTSIARLRGAVLAKDKSNALMELNEAYNHWSELGN